ncbi:hypothetical protein CEH05_16090 [Halobacillus halophilus]|nr:hypothetical protein CEH05_16090 [Halobacillus halophilus]
MIKEDSYSLLIKMNRLSRKLVAVSIDLNMLKKTLGGMSMHKYQKLTVSFALFYAVKWSRRRQTMYM